MGARRVTQRGNDRGIYDSREAAVKRWNDQIFSTGIFASRWAILTDSASGAAYRQIIRFWSRENQVRTKRTRCTSRQPLPASSSADFVVRRSCLSQCDAHRLGVGAGKVTEEIAPVSGQQAPVPVASVSREATLRTLDHCLQVRIGPRLVPLAFDDYLGHACPLLLPLVLFPCSASTISRVHTAAPASANLATSLA